jgi:hypothetical protein
MEQGTETWQKSEREPDGAVKGRQGLGKVAWVPALPLHLEIAPPGAGGVQSGYAPTGGVLPGCQRPAARENGMFGGGIFRHRGQGTGAEVSGSRWWGSCSGRECSQLGELKLGGGSFWRSWVANRKSRAGCQALGQGGVASHCQRSRRPLASKQWGESAPSHVACGSRTETEANRGRSSRLFQLFPVDKRQEQDSREIR